MAGRKRKYKEEQYNEKPTLEWTLNQLMKLYRDYEDRFNYIKDSKDPDVYDMIESIKKNMGVLLKQITEFQTKFGQMIDDDALRISKLSDKALGEEIERLTAECKDYLKRKRWYDENGKVSA